jgi:glycosyltransferase involved in cell wall biosynthesis
MIVTVVCDVLGEENNGTTVAAMNLIRSLKAKGHEVRVLCADASREGEDGFYIVPTLNLGPFNCYVRRVGVTLAKPDKQKIAEAGIESHVILLGKKENPYPYIKRCDLYLQPSRYEGKSVSVREAQILCKPVIITDYPTASSQIKSGIDGFIAPTDNEGCARFIDNVLTHPALLDKLFSHMSNHDYGNEGEVSKIYRIIGI